jgi:hypothetical protein
MPQSPEEAASALDAMTILLSQARDPDWSLKAAQSPGLARMWLGRVRVAVARIYGEAAIPGRFPRVDSISAGEAAGALAKGVLALDNLVSTLRRDEGAEEGAHRSADKVFIGHGGSKEWLVLKDFLTNRLALECEEFNSAAVAGVPNFVRLTQMLDSSCFAFLVMTAEDQHHDSTHHARENVVHEVGLFQGRLGPERAIVLLEEGCQEFSNIHGLGQIRFPPQRIPAAFEDIRRVLEREGVITPERQSKSTERRRPLSTEARNLLAAAASADGTIITGSVLSGRFLQAGGTDYGGDDRRAMARWLAGLEQLKQEEMVADPSGKGEVFEVTDLGYRTTDGF